MGKVKNHGYKLFVRKHYGKEDYKEVLLNGCAVDVNFSNELIISKSLTRSGFNPIKADADCAVELGGLKDNIGADIFRRSVISAKLLDCKFDLGGDEGFILTAYVVDLREARCIDSMVVASVRLEGAAFLLGEKA